MFQVFLKLEVGIFIDAADIKPTSELISEYLVLFADKGFIPQIITQIGPDTANPQQRLSFIAPDNSWSITFLHNRVNITRNLVFSGIIEDCIDSDIETVDTFIADAKELAGRVFDKIGRSGTRLAFICTALFANATSDKIDKAFDKLIIPLDLYSGQKIREWDYRTVMRDDVTINDIEEQVNIITIVKREKGTITKVNEVTDYNTIRLEFDYNTAHENKETRFNNSFLPDFLKAARDCFVTIASNVGKIVNE